MQIITEYFGTAFLHMEAGGLTIAIFAALLQNGGTISELVLAYMGTVCG